MSPVAALPDVPNVLRVQLRHTISADHDALCRFFLSYSGTAPTDAQCATFASGVRAGWATDIASLVLDQTQLTETTVTDLTTPSSGTGVDTTTVNGSGDASTNAGGLALVVSGKIVRRYRGGHPRIYLPYFGVSQLTTPQAWDGAALSTFLSAWNAFMVIVQGLTWATGSITSAVNISYFQGFENFTFPSGRVKAIPKLRTAGPVIDNITAWSLNSAPASQRRRNLTP